MSEQISNPVPAVPAVFQFENHGIRTVKIEGEPWFVAKDIAEVLGYVIPRKAIKTHCKHPRPIGGSETELPHELDPQTLIIKKNDIYRLIVRSEMPIADKFESWLFDEVLPAIEKHGHYSVTPAPHQLPTTRDPFQTLQLHYDVLAKHDSDIKSLTNRADQVEDIALEAMSEIEDLKNSRPLLPHQCHAIQKAVAEKVNHLSEKHNLAYRPVIFSAIYGFLKRHFQVNTYSAIAAIRFEEAFAVVKNLVLEQLPDKVASLPKHKEVTA